MVLALSTASALVRRDRLPFQPDSEREAFHRYVLDPFGIDLDLDRFRRSQNIGHIELAECALDALTPPVDSPDLLIAAYAIPDFTSLTAVAPRLNQLLGGRSHSFSISEQGLRAPFTALKIADAHARSGRCETLALFVCEQNTLPYADPFVDDNRLVNSAALLYFNGDDGFEFAGTRAGPPGVELEELTSSMTAALDPRSTLLVAGPWTAPDRLAATGLPVHGCEPGSYCTSVWLELARHHTEWARTYRHIVLCDTDPRTGRCQAALLRLRSAGPTTTENRHDHQRTT
jgi:hypothetical protein